MVPAIAPLFSSRDARASLRRRAVQGHVTHVEDHTMHLRESGSCGVSASARIALAAMVALTIVAPLAPVRAQSAAGGAAGAGAQALPASGKEVLQRMHDHWASGDPWFHTLTFKQQTTVVRADGTKNVSTWYEAILAPDRLRIDFGDPSEGNGVIYTADSVYRFDRQK